MDVVLNGIEYIFYEVGNFMLFKYVEVFLGLLFLEWNIVIMVIFFLEVVEDDKFICYLLLLGMNVVRINCVYDSLEVWKKMV